MERVMKTMITLVAVSTVMTGCSLFGGKKADSVDVPKTTAITRQKLSTYFEDDGIRVNWECIDRDWFPSMGLSCEESVITDIEATVTVPSNGGSNFDGFSAFQVGQMEAQGLISRFINEEITTERVVNLMVQNIEKADDTYRNPIAGTGTSSGGFNMRSVVGITSTETPSPTVDASTPNMNYAVRSNVNDTVRDLQTQVRGSSQTVQRGVVFEVDQKDDQLLQVTAIWSKDRAESITKQLAPLFQ